MHYIVNYIVKLRNAELGTVLLDQDKGFLFFGKSPLLQWEQKLLHVYKI